MCSASSNSMYNPLPHEEVWIRLWRPYVSKLFFEMFSTVTQHNLTRLRHLRLLKQDTSTAKNVQALVLDRHAISAIWRVSAHRTSIDDHRQLKPVFYCLALMARPIASVVNPLVYAVWVSGSAAKFKEMERKIPPSPCEVQGLRIISTGGLSSSGRASGSRLRPRQRRRT